MFLTKYSGTQPLRCYDYFILYVHSVNPVTNGPNNLPVLAVFYVIYQTRETVFHRDIQTPRRELKIRGAWIADETLSRVFDISSQSIPGPITRSLQLPRTFLSRRFHRPIYF